MTGLRLLRYDLRRAGLAALVTPPAALAVGALLVLASRTRPGERATAAVFVLQEVAPLAGGVALASVIGAEVAVELQLSLPAALSATMLRRWLLGLGWTAGLAAVTAVALGPEYLWPLSARALARHLIWLAPTLALAGLGAAVSAATRSTTAATAVLAVVWLGQDLDSRGFEAHPMTRLLFLFPDPALSSGEWLLNRTILAGAGGLALALAWAFVAIGEPPRVGHRRRLRRLAP
jgi:hypothetical protein